jgi:general secretion pathway protein J
MYVTRQRGFTLLEILIALALTAMLLSMLTAGVYGVVNDWDNNAEALERDLDKAVAILQIERALQGAFAHSFRDSDTMARRVYFDGQQTELSWVSSVSPERSPGMTAWRLYQDSRDGVYLQLAPALTDNPADRLQQAEARLLLPGYQMSIFYLYEDLEFNRVWRSDWPGVDFNMLPLAVHIQLEPMDRDNRDAVDIVAVVAVQQHRTVRPNMELIR